MIGLKKRTNNNYSTATTKKTLKVNFHGGRIKNTLSRSLLIIPVIIYIVAFLQIPIGSAQNDSPPIWIVRSIYPSEFGMNAPKGLTFSSAANAFFVPDETGNITFITMGEDHAGQRNIPAAQSDPLNTAFDDRSKNLFTFDRSRAELIKTNTDNRGMPIASAGSSKRDFKPIGLKDVQGIAFGAGDARLYILDAGDAQIISIVPDSTLGFDAKEAIRSNQIQRISLKTLGNGMLRGLALNPENGHLYIAQPFEGILSELTPDGELVSTYDLAALDIDNPTAMTFAPSVDNTDDPNIYDLFILDERQSAHSGLFSFTSTRQQDSSSKSKIVELSFQAPAALPAGTTLLPTTLVNIIDTSNAAWNPSAPDPAGVDFWPLTGGLLITDSEVNEMPNYYQGKNMFLSTTSGTLTDTCDTTSFSNEPTGVAINPNNNHIFISDDTGSNDKIFEVSIGSDGVYCTIDDTVTITNVGSLYGATDAEDVAYGNNTLFIGDGANAEVYSIPLGGNGVLGGGDDGPITHFDTMVLGFSDMEAIGYNADSGTLFITSPKGTERYLGEVSTAGILVKVYDLSLMGSGGNKRSDVTYAPGSQNPDFKNIYIASRNVDNNSNPNENDGQVWEINIGNSDAGTPTRTSTPAVTPTVSITATNTPLATFTATSIFTPTNTSLATATLTSTSTPVSGSTLTLVPIADSYIRGSSPATNYGSESSLQTDMTPQKDFLIKFDVSGINGQQVVQTVLRLYNLNGSNSGGDFYHMSDDAWQEQTVTWNTAPAADPAVLGSLGAVRPGNFYEVDLTSLISGDGIYSLRISSTSNNGADYSSREGVESPQLLITMAGGATFTPPSTVTPGPTPTETATATPTRTSAPTATFASTHTATSTSAATPTFTPLVSATSTNSPTLTPPLTATPPSTSAATATPLATATATSTATPGPTVPLTFISEADAHVREAQPNSNYSSSIVMWVAGGADPHSESFIHFRVNDVTGPIQSAVLRVYATSGTVDGPSVSATENTWTETGITWITRPAPISAPVDDKAVISKDTWVEYDVTSLVNGNGSYSFVLVSNNADSVSFSSREGSQPSQLVIMIGP